METKPRRVPGSESGLAIVASVLDAAEEFIVEHRLDQLRTNAIAERAGVSIGSLYQYFPNKQSIVAGINRRINERMVEQVRAAAQGEGTPQERLLALIRVICSEGIGDTRVRAALLEQVPREWETALGSAESAVLEIVDSLVRELGPTWTDEEVEDRKIAYVFAVRGAAQAALLYRPEMVKDGRLARILYEVLGSDA